VTGEGVAAAAQLACLLEVSAPKPGNVSPRRHFADTRFEDFLASAAAIGPPLAGAADRPLGRTIHMAVAAAARWTASNTNLGIVLLLAPIARAALRCRSGRPPDARRPAVTEAADLRAMLRRVLEATTVADAADVYAAIRQAAPGGLGRSDVQDVAEEPTCTLLDVMRLAADRDGIAREYATAFESTFETGVPALARARHDGLSWDDACVETFLTLLAARQDTHVLRRGGAALAGEVTRRAASALEAGGVRTAAGRRTIQDMDRALRDEAHLGNPGTTADLVAAAIFVVLLGGGWAATPRRR
jgi:triphosphoribosyl-dephospho-CoA synthase